MMWESLANSEIIWSLISWGRIVGFASTLFGVECKVREWIVLMYRDAMECFCTTPRLLKMMTGIEARTRVLTWTGCVSIRECVGSTGKGHKSKQRPVGRE